MNKDGAFEFLFSGMPFTARNGDTLAVALFRAGVKSFGVSINHERPRGLRWFDRPSDVAATLRGIDRQFDPAHLLLEPGMDIRPAHWATAPRVKSGADLDCEAVVIGGGPAGLAAALTLCRSGATVTLVTGAGSLGGNPQGAGDPVVAQWVAETIDELGRSDVQFLTNSRAIAATPDGWDLETGSRTDIIHRKLSAKTSVFAAGAMERMIAFCGNDLPGVMTPHALARLARDGALPPGQKIALFTNNDTAYQALTPVVEQGGDIVAVVDVRDRRVDTVPHPNFSGVVSRAFGNDCLEQIEITHKRRKTIIDCDVLAVSGGWSPRISPLISQSRRPIWNPTIEAWLSPPGSWPHVSVAGGAGGSFSAQAAIKSGYFRARRALGDIGMEPQQISIPQLADKDPATTPFWVVPGGDHTYVDFRNDVTLQEKSTQTGTADLETLAQRFLSSPWAR